MSLKRWVNDKKLIDRIATSIRANRVSHAYIIEAGGSVDKLRFAMDFLEAVGCESGELSEGYGCGECLWCRKIEHGNCEDLYVIKSDGMSVKKDMIEDVQRTLKKKPFGLRNMIIVEDTDTMTVKAQNRLLKTLEEPMSEAIIMLLADNSENLLQTVRSRCIIYKLNGEAANANGEAGSKAESEAQRKRASARELVDMIFRKARFKEYADFIAKNVKSKDDALLLLEGMEQRYRDILVDSDKEKNSEGRRMDAKTLIANIWRIEEARRDVLINVNVGYAIKNLILKIGG